MFKVPSENRFAILAMLTGIFLAGGLFGILVVDADKFREWFGASSGWAAAIAAFATLLFLKSTVDQARKSNKLLELQTQAITGELEPVFNYNGRATTDRCEIFRFWNYNRRAITLMSIELISPEDIYFSFVEIKRPGWKEADLLLEDSPSTSEYLEQFMKRSKRVDKITAVSGTPAGKSCKPVTFRIEFSDRDFKSRIAGQEVKLAIHWRFRDHNRENINTTTCTAVIGNLTVDEEEDPTLIDD